VVIESNSCFFHLVHPFLCRAQLQQYKEGIMIRKSIVDKFRASLHGQLIQPGDAYYDDGRKVWNGIIDKHPALIVRCADEADVISAVIFARTQGLLVAERVKAAYDTKRYERLVALKNKYDPTNLFRLNQNIKPSG